MVNFAFLFSLIFVLSQLSSSIYSFGPFKDDKNDGPFRVLRLIPRNEDQLDILLSLWKNASFYDLNFWQEPRKINANVDVMVNSKAFPYLTKMFNDTGLGYNVTIGNVKKLILENNAKNERFRKWSRRFKDESSNSPSSSFNLASYNSYDDIVKYLMAIQSEFPFISQVINIGKSHENRQLLVLKIGRPTGNFKRSIWVDAGIHAREWITPATALYFINQLVKKYDTDPKIKGYVDQLDWYIMPLVNPDGYEYTRQSVDPKVRLWRKNRSPPICRQSRWGQECCQGVDLNRNFDFHFGEIGASTNPCEEIFAGGNAFSEPETRAIADFILPRQSAFYAFVTLHSYSQIWMYPFGHQKNTYPDDVRDLKSVAEKAARALRMLYNTKYIVGTGADTLYPASGGSDDWAKLNAGIKFVYLIELRPEDNRWDGFILTEDQILPTARETWEGMKSVADAVVKYGTAADETTTSASTADPSGIKSPQQQQCSDTEEQCHWWMSIGGCTIWPDMDKRCPLSCKACTPSNAKLTPRVLHFSTQHVCFRDKSSCENWRVDHCPIEKLLRNSTLPRCRFTCRRC